MEQLENAALPAVSEVSAKHRQPISPGFSSEERAARSTAGKALNDDGLHPQVGQLAIHRYREILAGQGQPEPVHHAYEVMHKPVIAL